MEGQSICAISAAFVAQGPVLVGGSCPAIELCHLCGCEQCASTEMIGCMGCCFAGSKIATMSASVLLLTSTSGVIRPNAHIAVIADTIVLSFSAGTRTLTEASTIATIGASYIILPSITAACVFTLLAGVSRTLVGVGLTSIAKSSG